MKFSNFLFPASMDPSRDGQIIHETLREARICDELGMEMLWLAEHHFDGICAYVDPVTFAAALATSTERIHIGFAVAQMSLHHPVRMAEQMALIDNISRGRLLHAEGRSGVPRQERVRRSLDMPADARVRPSQVRPPRPI